MFNIDDRGIKQLERQFVIFAERAVPFATRATLDGTAFEARKLGVENIRNQMVLRNTFTVRSVQVEKVGRELNINRQESRTGATTDYLATQETGATIPRKGRRGVPIPTSYSAGQQGARPRTKVPRKANRLTSIQITRRARRTQSRAQQNKVAVLEAVRTGRRFIYMDLGRRRGLFRVIGSRRNIRVRMVYDLSRPTVTVPPNPWLEPATVEASRGIPERYRQALIFQAKRNKLFGY